MTGNQLLAQKALAVRLTIRQWTAKHEDRRATTEVASRFGTNPDAGRYIKRLVSKERIEQVQKIATKARMYHYANTLPWLDEGVRVLPAAAFERYARDMREMRYEFETLVGVILNEYDALRMDAQVMLGRLYRESDYPSLGELRTMYEFGFRTYPLPTEHDFRVDVGDDVLKNLREEMRDAEREAVERITADLSNRIRTAVSELATRLRAISSSKGGRLNESLVNNLSALIDTLPTLNVTNDPRFDELTQEMQGLVSHAPETLRENRRVRDDVAEKAERIQGRLRSMGL